MADHSWKGKITKKINWPFKKKKQKLIKILQNYMLHINLIVIYKFMSGFRCIFYYIITCCKMQMYYLRRYRRRIRKHVRGTTVTERTSRRVADSEKTHSSGVCTATALFAVSTTHEYTTLQACDALLIHLSPILKYRIYRIFLLAARENITTAVATRLRASALYRGISNGRRSRYNPKSTRARAAV